MRTRAADDIELARRATAGDRGAFAELFDRWFDRAHDVAWHIVRNRDTAADVAQETFATAWQGIGTLRRPESFGGWVLRIARNAALQRLAAEQRTPPWGDDEALAEHDGRRRLADDPADPVVDRERDDLVWAAAAALGDDDASILSLHLRHGLAAGDLAGELGIAPNAAHQRLFRLRKRLGEAIGAWTLWQHGRPRCDDLRQLLAAADATHFDREAAAIITAHTRGCSDCDDRRTLRLSPEVMFAATPLVAAGPAVKAQAAATLAASGTPASASTSVSIPEPAWSRPAGRAVGRSVAAGSAVVAIVGLVAAVLAGREDGYEPPSAPEVAGAEWSTATGIGATPAPASPTGAAPPGVGPPVAPRPAATSGPPVIGSFRAMAHATGSCATPGDSVTTFAWDSIGAGRADLGPDPGGAAPVDLTGTHTTCAAPGSTWTLTVTNKDGIATANIVVA